MKNLSELFCLKNSCVILRQSKNEVVVGISDQYMADSEQLKGRLRRYFGDLKTSFTAISQGEFEIRVKRMTSAPRELLFSESAGNNTEENNLLEVANTAPVVNLLNSIIEEAVSRKASDIHIENNELSCDIKFRIDGELVQVFSTDRNTGNALISRIKLLAQLNIMEHRRCQDGRFDYKVKNSTYDIRVSCIPKVDGESVVLRILGGNSNIPKLCELGFSKEEAQSIRKLAKTDRGLVLISGSTGNGKTTTMASILQELETSDKKVITVEDPVEYRIKGTTQIQVEEECGKTFGVILKRLLRHDPDILMVGEIRDEESANLACRMALTGHLVLASVHTGSAEECRPRLIDLGVPQYVVDDVLRAVIWQKLVKKEGGGRTVKAHIIEY